MNCLDRLPGCTYDYLHLHELNGDWTGLDPFDPVRVVEMVAAPPEDDDLIW